MTDSFIQKLMIAKQVMDKSNEIPRGGVTNTNFNESHIDQKINIPEPLFENPLPANYNIPQEYLSSNESVQTKPFVVTEDKIKNSKLPDVIKKLMIENPIQQPTQQTPTLSNDIIEKASRLMNNKETKFTTTKKEIGQQSNQSSQEIRKIVREELESILNENGLLHESESKSNELFQFRVGKHICEGKIVKVKKIS